MTLLDLSDWLRANPGRRASLTFSGGRYYVILHEQQGVHRFDYPGSGEIIEDAVAAAIGEQMRDLERAKDADRKAGIQ